MSLTGPASGSSRDSGGLGGLGQGERGLSSPTAQPPPDIRGPSTLSADHPQVGTVHSQTKHVDLPVTRGHR